MKSIIWLATIALAVGGVAGAANAQMRPDDRMHQGDRPDMRADMNRDGPMRHDEMRRHHNHWNNHHRHCTYRWQHHHKVRYCR